MTNGEKIKEIFPNIIKYGNILIDDTGALQKNILFDDTWWNAEYKEIPTGSTTKDGISNKSIIYKAKESKEIQEDLDKLRKLNTKNDLVVNCISRADALDCVNWGYSFSDVYKKINELPSVIPIQPKGHWINIDAIHSKCNRCGALFEIASANGEANYCPNCGSDNREVEQ